MALLQAIINLRERLKQPRQFRGFDADTRIGDTQSHGARGNLVAEGNLTVIGEFNGIAREIEQDLQKLSPVGGDRRKVLRNVTDELQPFDGHDRRDILHDLDDDLVETERALENFHSTCLDLGQIQDIVDQLQEMRGAVQNIAHVLLLFGGYRTADLAVVHQLSETDNGVER